jgi:predicted short-subunit dehydrogenase-like oxidoreductase (DUF2520 family)
VVFLAVPDPAVRALASELGAARLPDPAAIAVVHLSGALGLEALSGAAEAGHPVGSFHPLQSFPQPRPPDAFRGSLVAVDASTSELLEALAALAVRLGATPRRVPDEHRRLYHAAAVVASNYLVALTAQAAAILERCGWNRQEALAALLPLERGVLANLESQGLPEALIGPIRRGDPETVAGHLAALDQAGGLPAEVYRILGMAALELAQEAGLEVDAAEQIRAALTPGPGGRPPASG